MRQHNLIKKLLSELGKFRGFAQSKFNHIDISVPTYIIPIMIKSGEFDSRSCFKVSGKLQRKNKN